VLTSLYIMYYNTVTMMSSSCFKIRIKYLFPVLHNYSGGSIWNKNNRTPTLHHIPHIITLKVYIVQKATLPKIRTELKRKTSIILTLICGSQFGHPYHRRCSIDQCSWMTRNEEHSSYLYETKYWIGTSH